MRGSVLSAKWDTLSRFRTIRNYTVFLVRSVSGVNEIKLRRFCTRKK